MSEVEIVARRRKRRTGERAEEKARLLLRPRVAAFRWWPGATGSRTAGSTIGDWRRRRRPRCAPPSRWRSCRSAWSHRYRASDVAMTGVDFLQVCRRTSLGRAGEVRRRADHR
jgi:hypothetical protein